MQKRMLGIFKGPRSDHPLADLKEAKRLLEALPPGDALRALEEIAHWLESVGAEASFKPETRAQLVQLLDEAGQAPARKLAREYLSASRLGKQQETKLWTVIHQFWAHSALGYVTCLDAYATGAKGGDALKRSVPLLGVRALRALAAQLKWLQLRYGPVDERLWTMLCRTYAFLESRKLARASVAVYPVVAAESTPELEFLRAAMFSACSPDSLLPPEIEIAERAIALWSPSFLLVPQHQPETPYWIDLAQGKPPVRIARSPQPAPSVRFFGAGRASAELEAMADQVRKTREVPPAISLGGACAPDTVLGVLEHLEQCWAPKLAERRHPRHRVKSRLTIAWGFDGILEVLRPGEAQSLDATRFESWIVENVSVGGFGALVPQVRGDWLRIGCLLALQPEGGDNWLVGVVRRLSRPSLQQAAVGIQTLARSAAPIELRVQVGNTQTLDTETAILLDPDQLGGEVQILLRPGVHAPGESFIFDYKGLRTMLLPVGVAERRHDYELLRCRHLIRDAA
jgi:hypothetical protein